MTQSSSLFDQYCSSSSSSGGGGGSGSDSCGFFMAIIAAIAYGTFGVPIKETRKVNVHPLVLQSYKTITMFVCSWLVLFLGEKVQFTSWGILSGLLWVLGGTGGIYGIRKAGMSVAVGTWSSIMVLINFLVGILLFQEPVASVSRTFAAFVLLGFGLVGMSVWSAPSSTSTAFSNDDKPLLLETELMQGSNAEVEEEEEEERNQFCLDQQQGCNNAEDMIVTVKSDGSLAHHDHPMITARLGHSHQFRSHDALQAMAAGAATTCYDTMNTTTTTTTKTRQMVKLGDQELTSAWIRHGVVSGGDDGKKDNIIMNSSSSSNNNNNNSNGISLGYFTKRQLGIMGAVMNGIFTGSSLVPIYYAKKEGFGGTAYVLSFGTGALLSNLMVWLVWFVGEVLWLLLVQLLRQRNGQTSTTTSSSQATSCSCLKTILRQAYESMPPFYLRQLWKPGFSAGILLAIAMFGSILSVTYLGQGVGNSIVQSKILISGLWGIFWYKEISGRKTIAKWFASAMLAVTGILWLSYERIIAKVTAEQFDL